MATGPPPQPEGELYCTACDALLQQPTGACPHCGTGAGDLRRRDAGTPGVRRAKTAVRGELAPRLTRLAAVVFDSLLVFPVVLAAGFAPLIFVVALAIAGVQLYFLGRDGQTLGKKAVHIAIVDRVTGETPHWGRTIGLRLVLNGFLGIIPFYGVVDALFIFRSDRRTVHDMIAGTIVVCR